MSSKMDRRIEPKGWRSSRLVAPLAAAVIVLSLVVYAIQRSGTSRLTVDPQRLTTARVQLGEFREYYPFDGTVEPVTTVYLDIEEGGRVEQIFLEGGQHVEEGDLILRFSNATLQRNSIDTETRLVENLNALRNTQFNLAQNALRLEDALLDIDYQIIEMEKKHARYERLVSAGPSAITLEEFERTEDELAYMRDKRDLLVERIRQEEVLSRQQLEQAEQSIERLSLSLDLLNRIVDSLEVRAPISGFLSNIDAQIGQNIGRGQRVGQIDRLDGYKISVRIDQFYISRVGAGTKGRIVLDGESFNVVVDKIYPEVEDDVFTVDASVVGATPPSLRRGQRLTVELSFSEPTESVVVSRGGFYQQTGGRWAYLIAEDRRSARRAPIRVGRQNPRVVEVIEGLNPGDWIISSSYDTYNEADELNFSEPIELVP